jgi:hypothetical protein
MAYVLHVKKDGVNYCIKADAKNNRFYLVPVESDSDLSQIYSHPYRIGAVNILKWIQQNDQTLASEELAISDRDQFRK